MEVVESGYVSDKQIISNLSSIIYNRSIIYAIKRNNVE